MKQAVGQIELEIVAHNELVRRRGGGKAYKKQAVGNGTKDERTRCCSSRKRKKTWRKGGEEKKNPQIRKRGKARTEKQNLKQSSVTALNNGVGT
jgi:hypothetical protein